MRGQNKINQSNFVLPPHSSCLSDFYRFDLLGLDVFAFDFLT